ncbi:protein of unknown function [Burkholderia multivorans]
MPAALCFFARLSAVSPAISGIIEIALSGFTPMKHPDSPPCKKHVRNQQISIVHLRHAEIQSLIPLRRFFVNPLLTMLFKMLL